MKALILYFSGTGNTKYVAKKLEADLQKLGCDAELHSIEENFKIQPDSYDLLALGCPKYYEYPVLDFIKYIKKNLPVSTKTVPAVMFCTQTGPLGTDFKPMRKIITKKNHKLIVEKSIPIANNLLVMKAFGGTAPEKKQSNIAKAEEDIKALASCLVKNEEHHEEVGRFLGVVCRLCAVVCTKLFPVFIIKFSPSAECIGCGLCARKCPAQNIKMENNKPVFGKDCIFCTRCVNCCPVNAIQYHKEKHPQYEMIEKI